MNDATLLKRNYHQRESSSSSIHARGDTVTAMNLQWQHILNVNDGTESSINANSVRQMPNIGRYKNMELMVERILVSKKTHICILSIFLWFMLDKSTFTITNVPGSPLAFGNISVIVPNDDTTLPIPNPHAYKYTDVYTRNIQDATTRLKASCIVGSFPRRKTLAHVLSTPGCVYDVPTCVLPRPFKQGTVQAGTEFVIDFCKAVVDQVIAQESNEIRVVLNEDHQAGNGPIALKSQWPIGCLPWEYEILRKINDRVQNEFPRSATSPSPFPIALSFVFLADGALFTSSMESQSRMSLRDLKHVYDASGEEIPEVLILHYTARMLHSIEMLHWHAKVLVRLEYSQPFILSFFGFLFLMLTLLSSRLFHSIAT